MKIDVAGVQIDNLSKAQALEKIDEFVRSGSAHYGVTPYSEMIVFALNDAKYKAILNQADLSLADGAGIIWAAKHLGQPAPPRLTGRKFVYDIAKLAAEKNYSLSLIGGHDNVAVQSARKLKTLYPNLNVKLAISGRSFDDQIVREISESNSDILLIAYSPPKQELWLAENYQKLGC